MNEKLIRQEFTLIHQELSLVKQEARDFRAEFDTFRAEFATFRDDMYTILDGIAKSVLSLKQENKMTNARIDRLETKVNRHERLHKSYKK